MEGAPGRVSSPQIRALGSAGMIQRSFDPFSKPRMPPGSCLEETLGGGQVGGWAVGLDGHSPRGPSGGAVPRGVRMLSLLFVTVGFPGL